MHSRKLAQGGINLPPFPSVGQTGPQAADERVVWPGSQVSAMSWMESLWPRTLQQLQLEQVRQQWQQGPVAQALMWQLLHQRRLLQLPMNAQAASILASVGGGSCGPTSSRFYVESSVTAITAIAAASSATSVAQACGASVSVAVAVSASSAGSQATAAASAATSAGSSTAAAAATAAGNGASAAASASASSNCGGAVSASVSVSVAVAVSASTAVSTGKATGGLPASAPPVSAAPAPPVPGLPPGVVELHPAAGPLAARRPPQDLGGPHHRLGVLPLRQHQGEALWPGDPHQVHLHAPGGPRPRQEPGDPPHRRAAAPSTRHRQGEASLQRGGPHRVHPAAHPLPHHPAVVPPVPHPVRCGLWLVLLPWNYYAFAAGNPPPGGAAFP
ncbi:hypothetical protein COCSUDRAFT_60887 [Coccomyxa subellipsoidea C-169]|uniref:Uncharacterized protein n=1 Tax=Coccomyxa subellipsoidea (strain C-169) TaxID=574566 RepID=I0Z5G0_COCSC|nr:hypothetical protein COCSUDRAFT_60887 [Coccomyxa subellipsoidea C-169]EIE25879.1 hypothetical protein COCSUDRAFT_60887 [Coccomyxa subellipsoidea C-169]|eukprot:XP_005650423.1 hypothetical protein COCSUDRAFT_60887 [Coccomyxa subellipsoidea C-169]